MKLERHSLPILKGFESLDLKCLDDYIIDLDFFAYNDSLCIYEEVSVNEYLAKDNWIQQRAKNNPNLGFKYSNTTINSDGSINYNENDYEIENIECSLFLFDYSWGHNYQHWLISSLSRLFVYCELKRKNINIKLLINADMPSYKFEVIKLLGINDSELYFHNNATKYNKIYTCNFNSGSGIRVSALSLNYYTMLSNSVHEGNRFSKKIYLTRDDSLGKRPLKNRKEVDALLIKSGFELVKLEELNFREKITLFKYAEVIVGDFSAGWGHIVFCNENTKLILLEHDIYKFQHFYESIAKQKNMKFIAISSAGYFRLVKLNIYKFIWSMTKTVDRNANALPWSVDIKKLKDIL